MERFNRELVSLQIKCLEMECGCRAEYDSTVVCRMSLMDLRTTTNMNEPVVSAGVEKVLRRRSLISRGDNNKSSIYY